MEDTVTSNSVKLNVKSKIWIENDKGEVVFGEGRLKILNAVERCGSILAASNELHMSYRAVWGKIRATEERLGQQLLVKHAGGVRGGGSDLTPFAKELISRFRNLDRLIRTTTDTLFKDIFVSKHPE